MDLGCLLVELLDYRPAPSQAASSLSCSTTALFTPRTLRLRTPTTRASSSARHCWQQQDWQCGVTAVNVLIAKNLPPLR